MMVVPQQQQQKVEYAMINSSIFLLKVGRLESLAGAAGCHEQREKGERELTLGEKKFN